MRITGKKTAEFLELHDQSCTLHDDLQQLAEECSELAIACSKISRACGHGYATACNKENAIIDFTGEVSDVLGTLLTVLHTMKSETDFDETKFWKEVNECATEKEERFIRRWKGKHYGKA